jgi:hypothetical protein
MRIRIEVPIDFDPDLDPYFDFDPVTIRLSPPGADGAGVEGAHGLGWVSRTRHGYIVLTCRPIIGIGRQRR